MRQIIGVVMLVFTLFWVNPLVNSNSNSDLTLNPISGHLISTSYLVPPVDFIQPEFRFLETRSKSRCFISTHSMSFFYPKASNQIPSGPSVANSFNQLGPIHSSTATSYQGSHLSDRNKQPLDSFKSRLDAFISMGLPFFLITIFSILGLILFGIIVYSLVKALISKFRSKEK